MAATTSISSIAHIAGHGSTAGSNFSWPETAIPFHSASTTNTTKTSSAAPASVPPVSDTVNLSLAATIQSLLQQGMPATEITAQLGVSAEQVNIYLPTYVPPSTTSAQAVTAPQPTAPADIPSESSASAIQKAQI